MIPEPKQDIRNNYKQYIGAKIISKCKISVLSQEDEAKLTFENQSSTLPQWQK